MSAPITEKAVRVCAACSEPVPDGFVHLAKKGLGCLEHRGRVENGRLVMESTWMAHCGCGQPINDHDRDRHDLWISLRIGNLENRVLGLAALIAMFVLTPICYRLVAWIWGLAFPS